MKRENIILARQNILKKQVDDNRLDKVIKYLNTKYIPDEIGILFNRSFEYEKYRVSGIFFFKKYLHLVFIHSTVESISGEGLDSRRGVATYPSHVFAFEDEHDAKLFCDYSNILCNRDTFQTHTNIIFTD